MKKKKKVKLKYDDLVDVNKIQNVYHTIKINTKHKDKIVKFELFLTANFINILDILQNRNYVHSKYNIFLITKPKARVIMSESITDKIINHLVSKYCLEPIIEPILIDMNVATRKDKGSKLGIFYMKKYINSLKINNDKVYALKCDIHKFFYSIDHKILINKLSKLIKEKEIMNLLITIINSTDLDYINKNIMFEINRMQEKIESSNISTNDKLRIIEELNKIPMYEKGKGLPIGNMSSQIMAIFYLNDLDHFIKEKLKCKYYIRYMDDLILLSNNKKYLEYCLSEIENYLVSLLLKLNNKTKIYEIHNGVSFLGYKFIVKNQRLYTLIDTKTKKRIKKRIKVLDKKPQFLSYKSSYNGYLCHADSGNFIYHNYVLMVIKHNKKIILDLINVIQNK